MVMKEKEMREMMKKGEKMMKEKKHKKEHKKMSMRTSAPMPRKSLARY